jgi:hypothetical protein|tara:strand:- start:1437 stop:1691 length:255 start_codon:yes stop_codon:yes gene_type:complete
MTREEIAEYNEEALICDGFDEAIIGVAERINLGPVAAYSVEKIIEILMERDDMTYEDAHEHFSYNIIGSWMGEYTPVFIYTNQE